jgi:hypothetical protein
MNVKSSIDGILVDEHVDKEVYRPFRISNLNNDGVTMMESSNFWRDSLGHKVIIAVRLSFVESTQLNEKGRISCVDGPVFEDGHGSYCWRFNGEFHRVGGPAVCIFDYCKYWFVHNKLHRIDGPAVEYEYLALDNEYWYKDRRISKEEFYSDEFQIQIVMES